MCDYPEFINETDQRSRKPRWCCECGIRIGIGEMYHKVTGKWDGELSSFAQCEPCASLWHWMNTEVECLSFGRLREGMRDNDMLQHVPREMLSHKMLMWMHEREIDEAENAPPDGVDILPPPPVGRLVGLLRVYDENRSPRLWKQYQERLIENARHAGGSLSYYAKRAAQGDEWCAKQLERPVIR